LLGLQSEPSRPEIPVSNIELEVTCGMSSISPWEAKPWLACIYQPKGPIIKIRYQPKSDVRAGRRFAPAEMMAFKKMR
jgi:hypothetical protein